MNDEADLDLTLRRIDAILRKLGLTFHLTGGLVSSFYGEPRFTQDVDLVIRLSGNMDETRNLIVELQACFLIDPEFIGRAVTGQDMFQALDTETYIKIDFHVGESIPGELDRSTRQEILPGLSVPIASKEDAILSKLLWIAKGSEKSRRDVVAMLRNPECVDLKTLQETASSLGVFDLLEELCRAALGR